MAVKEGDNAVLRCLFDLNGDSLYSVKWYKGGREMYRYMPREVPSVKVFPIAGLTDLYIEVSYVTILTHAIPNCLICNVVNLSLA